MLQKNDLNAIKAMKNNLKKNIKKVSHRTKSKTL